RQESCGAPSTSTAQAPHSPSSQPCLVPVRPRSSRSTSRSVLYGAKATSSASPLTVIRCCTLRRIVWPPNNYSPWTVLQRGGGGKGLSGGNILLLGKEKAMALRIG